MEYRLIQIFPYQKGANTELEQALRDGWTLHGSPFTARPDEYFQTVTRSATLKEPAGSPARGSLSHG